MNFTPTAVDLVDQAVATNLPATEKRLLALLASRYQEGQKSCLVTLPDLSKAMDIREAACIDVLVNLVRAGHVTFCPYGRPVLHFGAQAVFNGLMHRLTLSKSLERRS
jgi:hypothetical protein